MTSAEIITIGTEILLGEIVDTNTRYIARTLRSLGVDLYRTITIGDNVERIANAIQNSMQRADIVITTGGLGPTVDDPTRDAVAKAIGVPTEFREDLWQQVVETISRYGRTPSENQKRQAYVPQGAIGLKNPVGTAPCFIVDTPLRPPPISGKLGGEQEGGVVISLPGVPAEMEHVLHESVIPYLQNRFQPDEVIGVVKPPAPGGIGAVGPFVTDDDDKHLAGAHGLLDRVYEIGAGLDTFDVHEHTLRPEMLGQPVIQAPGITRRVVASIADEDSVHAVHAPCIHRFGFNGNRLNHGGTTDTAKCHFLLQIVC